MAPWGGAGGGFSHFKLKWMGRPLIVKDTALRAYGQTSLRLSVAEGSWLGRGRRPSVSPAGRPLLVKDTALRAYGQTSLRLSVAEGSWLARGGCWYVAPLDGCDVLAGG